jgi:hypothetical protein
MPYDADHDDADADAIQEPEDTAIFSRVLFGVLPLMRTSVATTRGVLLLF